MDGAAIAAVLIVAGVVNKHCVCAGWPNLGEALNDVIGDFYTNVSVDCLCIAFAILVIEWLNERRAEQELKAQLIRELDCPVLYLLDKKLVGKYNVITFQEV
jgi:hypothetical protein